MLVYICCAGGATSSLFCKKIKEATNVPTVVDDIITVLKNYDSYTKDYEVILAYGPAEFLRERYINEKQLGKKIASVWIAPQERFMQPAIEKLFATYQVPVKAIDMRTFGTMDGKKAWADIMSV